MKNLSMEIKLVLEEFNGFKLFTTSENKNIIIKIVNNFDKKHKEFLGRGDVYKFENFIIRKYFHGGIFRKFLKDNFTSENRFIKEFKILIHLNNLSFDTVKGIGVIVENGILKKGWLVTTWVEHIDFINYLKEKPDTNLESIFFNMGKATKKLHKLNIVHNDLHLKNFLINNNKKILIIDFDKSYFSDNLSLQLKDIKRFIRSIYKYNFYNENPIDISNIKSFLRGYGLPDNFYENVEITLKNKISWLLNKPKS